MSLEERVRSLYDGFGQQKSMGESAPSTQLPHYFLLRTFLGENDLLVIFNTKRCRYQCDFCQLPAKSSRKWIPGDDILAQFEYVINEVKHSLSILDRLTFSNDGSVLDSATFPTETLLEIATSIHELRRARHLILETRLEYVDPDVIQRIKAATPRTAISILTGFETQDAYIRDKILAKREPLDKFQRGLDKVAESKSDLISYVLYKPSPSMTDEEAFAEAEKTIDYLVDQCRSRGISVSIRLNPMYLAQGSKWAKLAHITPNYTPPRLTDVMRLAERKVQQGVSIYIGLSTEGLDEGGGNYMSREDYSSRLIKPIKLFNDQKILQFDWESISELEGNTQWTRQASSV